MSYMDRKPSDSQSRAPTYQSYDQRAYNASGSSTMANTPSGYNDPYSSTNQLNAKSRFNDQPYQDEPDNGRGSSAYTGMAPLDTVSTFEKGSAMGSKFSPATPRAGPTSSRFTAARESGLRTTSNFRTWRRDFHGSIWTKGRGINCFFRFCCCTLLIVIFLIASIILTLAVYVRPPDITFNNVTFNTNTGSAVEVQPNGLTINLNIDITVANPNFFSADFQSIDAVALYPISGQPDTPIGGGTSDNVLFKSDTISVLAFPFAINYTTAIDPTHVILEDILTKCGFLGAPKTNLNVNYQLTLAIKIIAFTISPQFTGSASFECPLTEDEVQLLVGGLNIPGLTLGGGGS